MQVQSPKTSGNRNRVSGFLRLFVLSLLTAAFTFTSLHAQTVAYVANENSNSVSVIDTASNTVTATIPVGNDPAGVVFSPDGALAYVTNILDGTISVIDTASNAVTTTIVLGSPGNTFPLLPAITPDGKNPYVPDFFGNVFVVNTATNTVTATIITGGSPSAVAITPDGTRAYVQDFDAVSNGIPVIDTATNTVIATVSGVGSFGSFGIAGTPNGQSIYATGGSFLGVRVISTASNTVTTNISFPADLGIAISPDGSRAYFIREFPPAGLAIIDTATNTVEAGSVTLGNDPLLLAVTPDGAFVYVTDGFGNTVFVIDTSSNTVVATVPVGSTPFGIAIAKVGVPFASFPAPTPGNVGNPNRISLSGNLSLGANSPGLDFAHQPMTLTVGGFSLLFPAGTVTQVGNSSQQHFTFSGTLNGLSVTFDLIGNSPNFSYSFAIQGKNVGTQVGPNPVTVTLKIGHNSGSSTVNF